MSLDSPNIIERFFSWIQTPLGVRVGIYLLAGLAAIGGTLFVLDRIGGAYQKRQITKAQTNLNGAVANLKKAQDSLSQDRNDIPVAVEDVKIAANTLLQAKNSSEAAQIATNTQLQVLSNVVNANKRVDVVANDIVKQLNDLDSQ